MRWIPFFILAYIVLGLEQGLSGYVELSRARPNLVLIVVIFIAANAPRDIGLLACLILGATQDLLGSGPWGLTAFSYALVAMAVIATQEFVYRDHFLTHFTFVLVGGWLDAFVRMIHGWIYFSIHHGAKWSRPGAFALLTGAIYTAVLGVPIIYFLQRMRRRFGFRTSRRGS